MNKLGENRIKELRELAGMNQIEFSLYLGIPVRTIQNWENGYRKANDYLILLIEEKIQYDKLKTAISSAMMGKI